MMIAKDLKLTRTPPLEQRIKQIRADIDAIIDAQSRSRGQGKSGRSARGDPQPPDRARPGLPLRAIS